MLPDDNIGSSSILAVVEEDDTADALASTRLKLGYSQRPQHLVGRAPGKYVQAIGVHGLASVELKVLEVGQQLLLDVRLGTLLKLLDILLGLASLLQGTLDGLEVALQVGQVALLVKRGALQAERAQNVVDADGGVLDALFGLLSGSIGTGVCTKKKGGRGEEHVSQAVVFVDAISIIEGTRTIKKIHTDLDGLLSDHGAVGLENNAINVLEFERVRDDLVAGENVLDNDRVSWRALQCHVAKIGREIEDWVWKLRLEIVVFHIVM